MIAIFKELSGPKVTRFLLSLTAVSGSPTTANLIGGSRQYGSEMRPAEHPFVGDHAIEARFYGGRARLRPMPGHGASMAV
jgi:hypothetical protein